MENLSDTGVIKAAEMIVGGISGLLPASAALAASHTPTDRGSSDHRSQAENDENLKEKKKNLHSRYHNRRKCFY